MVMFFLFIVLVLIALIVFGCSFLAAKGTDGRIGSRVVSAGIAGLACIFLFLSSFATVDTKHLGVTRAFGKITGYTQNGWQWKAPWETITEVNDAVITDTYASDGGSAGKIQGGAVGTCINVRIARQATACVNVSIRWQIREDGVDYLFRNYKNNEAIQDNVMLRDLQQAMNEKFITYDPLGIDTNGNSTNKALTQLSGEVQNQMRTEIGKYIDVQSVIIPLLNFDSGTQDRINQLQQQVAQTRIAQQAKLTADAQALANQAIAASLSNDPNVLVNKCLDILHDAVNKGQALPAGFSCFGAATPVAVGVK